MVSLHSTRPDDDPPDDGPTTDPVSTYHAILANPTRRFILRYLAATDGPTPIADLDAAVADALEAATPATLADDRVTAAAIGLVHVHLPKLVEAGYVEWDRPQATLVLTADAPGPRPPAGP